MPISSFHLQYSNVNAAQVAAAGLDAFIAESAGLTDAQRIQIQGAGTEVYGYVNVSVTDHLRDYWNPAWTEDPEDRGPVTALAPDWLKNQPSNPFGFIVDFSDASWQTIVIDQARAIVQAGYDGVFLDDVLSYFVDAAVVGQTISQQAATMMTLVSDVTDAIEAINPAAKVIVNGSPYIVTDAPGGIASTASQRYLGDIDAVLLESYFGVAGRPCLQDAINQARTVLGPHADLLAIEFGATASEYYHYLQNATAQGIVGTVTAGSSYSSFIAPVQGPTTGADTMTGTACNDTLDGGLGGDTMRGGAGNDVYIVDDAGDVVDESAAGSNGFDIVRASVTANLGSGAYLGVVEAVTLTGTGNVNAIGNLLANVLTGNAGNNVLNGQAGADAMRGRGGSDTYVVDNAGDVVDESLAGSSGFDRVLSSVTVNLSNAAQVRGAVERVELTGAANVNGIGNLLANSIVGNAGNNVLNGLAGNDVLTGGAGRDAFVFTTAPGAGNVDRITDFDGSADRIWLDDAVFAALGPPGPIAGTELRVFGTGPQDANDFLLYNPANGALYYDADAGGDNAAILFAVLGAGTALDSGDFLIV